MWSRHSMAVWLSGSRPSLWALTATPSAACRCSTAPASSRAMCTALWMVKPAGLTRLVAPGSTISPSESTLISDDAVISSNSQP